MMNRLPDLPIIARILAVTCGLVSLIIVLEIVFGGNQSNIGPTDLDIIGTQQHAPVELQSPKFPPVAEYGEVIARTLFTPSRELPEPVEEIQEDTTRADQLRKQWSLTGVVISPENTYAMLNKKAGKQTLKLRHGERIQGWEVTEIEPYHVSLASGDQTVDLPLYEATDAGR